MDAGSWWQALRRVPAPLVDVGLAVALTVAVALAITFGVEQGREPDALAYALAPTIGALSLLRRRWPLAVLLASAAALILYNQPAYPGLFSSVPLSVALVTAWAAGRRGWALAVVAWFGLTPLVFVAVTDLPGDFAARVLSGAVSDLPCWWRCCCWARRSAAAAPSTRRTACSWPSRSAPRGCC
jgi:hypothetical protein